MLNPWEDTKSIITINATKSNSINCLNVNNTKEVDSFCSKQFLQHVFHNIAKKKNLILLIHLKTAQVITDKSIRKNLFLNFKIA